MDSNAMDILMLYYLNPTFLGEREDLLTQDQDEGTLVVHDDDVATELGLELGDKDTNCN